MNDSETFDDDDLTVSKDTEVDNLASQFRTELFAGKSPNADEFLQSVSGQRREELQKKCTAIFREADDIASLHDRYEIECEAGSGAMGTVFKARHRALNMPVAVKVLHPGLSSDRFQREARLLASISSSYVVKVHDIDVLTNGHPMICMEWVDGEDLAKLMSRSGGRIREAVALHWMVQTAEGLDAAAEMGITHRDFKPSNVLIDSRGNARVADFGLAVSPGEFLAASQSGGIMGTPYYMAPEQAEDPHAADRRSDIYSYGAAFYHALTGQVPFDGNSIFNILFKHKTEQLVPPQSVCSDLSDNINQVLEKCLAKAPNERFQSFSEIKYCLAQISNPAFRAEEFQDDELQPHIDHYKSNRRDYLGYLPYEADHSRKETDVYHFPNGRELQIVHGNIVDQDTEVIVSSDDSRLRMGGAIGNVIARRGGRKLWLEAQAYAPARPGRVVVTRAGQLPNRFVFHAVTIGERLPSRDIIAELINSCFYHADSLNITSIAFPLIGTGAGGFSREACLDMMFRIICRKMMHGLTSVTSARIVIVSSRVRQRYGNPYPGWVVTSDPLQVAAQEQSLLRPKNAPTVAGYEIDFFIGETALGGHFLEFVSREDGLVILQGKALESERLSRALLAAKLAAVGEVVFRAGTDPQLSLQSLNQQLSDSPCTGQVAAITMKQTADAISVDYGGSFIGAVRQVNGETRLITSGVAPLIGVDQDVSYPHYEINLASQESLLVCNDHIINAENQSSERYGESRLLEVLAGSQRSATHIVNAVKKDLVGFSVERTLGQGTLVCVRKI